VTDVATGVLRSEAGEDAGRSIASGVFPPVPGFLAAVAALVLAAGLAMTIVGAGRTGVSVDEAGHVNRLEAFIHDGLYVRGTERAGTGEDGIPPNAYVYAPGTALAMHAVNVAVGNEQLGHPSDSAAAYTVRHYVVAAMSVLGVCAVFGLGWLMLGGWRWGLVASAVLTAVPMWTGHAMFNPKDTPVAVGYTLMTFSMAALVAAAGRTGRARLLSAGVSVVGMILGIALMVGTRPGIWPGVVGGTVVALGLLALARAVDRWLLLAWGVGLVGAYGALLIIYPRIFSHPVAMLQVSLGQTVDFASGSDAPDRSYVFERTGIEWPLLLLTFMVIGTMVGAWLSVRLLRTDPTRAAVIGLVGAQAFGLTIAAIITKSNLYDGLRQLLFAVPAQAVLATLGIAAALTLGHGTVTRWVLVAVAAAALVLPTIVQARLFPYQYAYGNVAAEALGAEILNDSWRVSFREYVAEIPPTVKAICPHNTPKSGPIEDVASDCRGSWGVVVPYWLAYWHHDRYSPDSPEFYLVQSASRRRPVPSNCKVVQRVTRNRNLERVLMSRLLLCMNDHPGLPGRTGGAA
jgi:hypothetical protein